MDEKKLEEIEKDYPRVFFKSITFNDNAKIGLKHNSIVVFTGANNVGKSQVLKDADNIFCQNYKNRIVVMKSAEYEYTGLINNISFLEDHFFQDERGYYHIYECNGLYSIDIMMSSWSRRALASDLHKAFVKRLCTEERLTTSKQLDRSNRNEKRPLQKLYYSEELAETISTYFSQAFGQDLIVNRGELGTVPLHVGKAPDKEKYTINRQDEYYKLVAAQPKLDDQGDGMRSFASILIDTFTSNYSITLIDEPEAFLHPPQARILGRMLAENNPVERQLFISTHSEDFLQGLLDAGKENVTVIRINRANNINHMNVLCHDEIKRLWSNPILRYSNMMSGMFHEKVIVCESDYDCLFYHAVVQAMYANKNAIAPDIMFTHCGGKSRIKDVVTALKAVNVPVVSIVDFDILNSSQELKQIVKSFGVDYEKMLSQDMKIIYDSINGKNSNKNIWENLKKIGKAGFDGDAPAAYEKVETLLYSNGLFIVPVGEMECFDKTVNKGKKEWVFEVLEKYELATEPKLEAARAFLQKIIDYKL